MSTSKSWRSTRDDRREGRDRFVAEITDLCADRGTRADLRSGLGRPVKQCGRMHRYLARRVPENSYGEHAYYAVAALIADRPRSVRDAQSAIAVVPTDEKAGQGRDSGDADDALKAAPLPWKRRPNLGTSLALAVRAGMKEGSAESHLRLLTRQSFTSVHPRLHSLVRYAQDKGAEIDWAVLLDDLVGWDTNRDAVATRWLQSFYRTLSGEPPNRTPDSENNSETEKSENR
ncbi:type I-E CRISPR-associated protein Cse2/CasB [Streptomyces sp. NPDC051569]|uniref:type I-E CRISPR-associated protein Cse2/CasB n=1 Tax=Streptomyces sp. NPDC051569 TaxID=3365661 RepID=UPI0037AA4D93